MSDRTISVYLRAEVADFKRQMAQAADATRDASSNIDRNGQKIETSMGRMVRSAEVNREAWQRSGAVLVAYGASVAGLATALLNTGIAYNTLQQSSRAALTTLLRSAESANAQMDKLDDFARNSPFAKQVFITAQQQMLGFGVEAKNVIPTLDAIQNAVAAMGGSNEQIAALAEIMSRMNSEGRLSGDALQRLGYYGIDAAKLIGDEMGKTAAQIRDMASEPGGIPVGQIWDPLVNGMQAKFGGAAANVKQTYVGALDRVKAAWRDLASELAAPLVDPKGGGALVGWLNNLADAMRGFQRLPDGLKRTIAAAVGLTATISLLGGGFLLLAPRLLAANAALSRVGLSMGKLAKGGGFATALLVGVTALTSAFESMNKHVTVGVEETTSALLKMTDISSVFDGISDDTFGLTGNINDMADAAHRITNPSLMDRIQDIRGWVRGHTFGHGDTGRTEAIDQIDLIGQALANLVNSGHADIAAQRFDVLRQQWEAGGGTLEELNQLMPAYREALAAVDNQQQLAAQSGQQVVELTEEQKEAIAAAQKAYDDWADAIEGANSSFISLPDAYQAVIDKNKDLAQSTADATKSAKDSWGTYYDGTTVKIKDLIKQLEAQTKAQKEWQDNVNTLAERINTDTPQYLQGNARAMLNELAAQGQSSAPVLDALAGATDAQWNKIVALWGEKGEAANNEFSQGLTKAGLAPEIQPDIDFHAANEKYWDWKQKIEADTVTVHVSTDAYNSNYGSASSAGRVVGGGGGGGVPRRYGFGGPIVGIGSDMSDNIPIMASPNEYMQTAAAHRFWGTPTMDAIRRQDVRAVMAAVAVKGYRDGGTIAPAAPQVVTVPVSSTHRSEAPTVIHNAYFANPGQPGLDALGRLNRKSGGR